MKVRYFSPPTSNNSFSRETHARAQFVRSSRDTHAAKFSRRLCERSRSAIRPRTWVDICATSSVSAAGRRRTSSDGRRVRAFLRASARDDLDRVDISSCTAIYIAVNYTSRTPITNCPNRKRHKSYLRALLDRRGEGTRENEVSV